MKNSRIMITAIAAGVILGVLFAPDKGSETRRRIRENRQKMANRLKDLCNWKDKCAGMKEEIEEGEEEYV